MLKKGRVPSPKEILGVRVLTRDDLEHLRQPRQAPLIQRLRDPHHLLARLLASGLRVGEAAHRAGYSYARTRQLMLDPTFQNTIAEYRTQVNGQWLESIDEYTQLAMGNMLVAERMIAEDLEEQDERGERPSLKVLTSISEGRADRFGYGKKQTNVNVNVDFAAQLERAIKRSGKVIESGAVAPVQRQGSQHQPQSHSPRLPAPVAPEDAGSQPFRRRA